MSFTNLQTESCYLPNGTEASIATFRCNPDIAASACCAYRADGSSDECTTAGLCKMPETAINNQYWRNYCSDPTWQSDDCPKYCWQQATGVTATDNVWMIFACTSTTYCCSNTGGFMGEYGHNYGRDCCEDQERVFTAGAAVWMNGGRVTTAILPSTSTSPNSSSSPTTSILTSPSSTLNSDGSTNGSTSGRSNTGSSHSIAVGAAVGIGVGTFVALALCASLVWVLLRARKRRQTTMPEQDAGESKKIDSDSPEDRPQVNRAELSDDSAVHEAGSKHVPFEADQSHILVELDGDDLRSPNK